jgi:hypothetical protein
MSTIINATTTNGVVIQPDNSGSLALQTNNGTAAVTIDTSQNATFAGKVTSAGALTLASNGTTTAVTINTSQNVGIGTASPSAKLSVTAGSSNLDLGLLATVSSKIEQTTGDLRVRVSSSNSDNYLESNRNIIFGTGASYTERMRIDSSGNVLVGTTSQVYSGKQVNAFSGATHNGLALNETANTSGTTYIGFLNGGTAIGSIGRVGATSAVVYNTTSDERLKSNIVDSDSVLDTLMQMQVRQYDWTEGNVHQEYGFIAQELEPILSGIVTKGKTDDDMWQLDYSRLTPHLVKAIQEQQTIINDLKARVETLEAK